MEATLAHNTIGNTLDDARAIKRTGIGDMAPTVSVIDGDISVRHSLDRFIRTAGWEPEPFASAEEFLSHPRGTLPCCVIVDLTLPGLSGLELQRQLAGRPDMPIISSPATKTCPWLFRR